MNLKSCQLYATGSACPVCALPLPDLFLLWVELPLFSLSWLNL